jgi:hypothetical protein
MLTLQEERKRLAKADQLIANGDRCRAGQKIRIAEMERRGEGPPDRPGDASGVEGGPYAGALASAIDPGRDHSPLTRFFGQRCHPNPNVRGRRR